MTEDTEAEIKARAELKAKAEHRSMALSKPRPPTKAWAEAEVLFANGDATASVIARKLGVTIPAVTQHMRIKKIKSGMLAAEHSAKVAAKVTEAILSDVNVLAARIKETKEDHYKMASGLAKLTWAEILKAKQDGLPVSVAMNNLKALDSAMSVLKKAREERYAVLGLDKEDYVDEEGLPELVISELTADQVEALRSRDENIDDIPDDVVFDDEDIVVEEAK